MLEIVKKVIDENVRTYLSDHGGDIEVICVHEGVVKIRLLGNCSGCPSARLTVENIVETALKQHIPAIREVIIESNISEDMLAFAKKLLADKQRG